jgi:hypothetical protein
MSAPPERHRIKIHGMELSSARRKQRRATLARVIRGASSRIGFLPFSRLEPRLSSGSHMRASSDASSSPKSSPGPPRRPTSLHDQRSLNEPLDEDCYRTRPRRSLFITIRKPVSAIYVVAYGIRPTTIAGEQCFRLSDQAPSHGSGSVSINRIVKPSRPSADPESDLEGASQGFLPSSSMIQWHSP